MSATMAQVGDDRVVPGGSTPNSAGFFKAVKRGRKVDGSPDVFPLDVTNCDEASANMRYAKRISLSK